MYQVTIGSSMIEMLPLAAITTVETRTMTPMMPRYTHRGSVRAATSGERGVGSILRPFSSPVSPCTTSRVWKQQGTREKSSYISPVLFKKLADVGMGKKNCEIKSYTRITEKQIQKNMLAFKPENLGCPFLCSACPRGFPRRQSPPSVRRPVGLSASS